MPFRHISPDLKQRSLWLLEQGYVPDEICYILGISRSSLRRWEDHYEEFGHVIPPHNPLQGRPRLLAQAQFEDLIQIVKTAPHMYLDELQDWLLIHHNVFLGRTTLHSNLQNAGLTYKLLRREAAERNEEARAGWMADRGVDFVAKQGVWTDETSKDECTIYRHYGRAPSGNRAAISAPFIRGERYSILPAMTVDGYIATRVVTGSVDGAEFIDFILQDVLPQMNPYPQDRSVLILDNCAIHRSQLLRAAIEDQGCRILFLPPYSPDFNPIEESFSSLKAYMRRNYRSLEGAESPELELYNACLEVTGEKAKQWILHSGYNF